MAHVLMILSLAMGVGWSCAVALTVPSSAIGQYVCCNIQTSVTRYTLEWKLKGEAESMGTKCKVVDQPEETCNLPGVKDTFKKEIGEQLPTLPELNLRALAEQSALHFLNLQREISNRNFEQSTCIICKSCSFFNATDCTYTLMIQGGGCWNEVRAPNFPQEFCGSRENVRAASKDLQLKFEKDTTDEFVKWEKLGFSDKRLDEDKFLLIHFTNALKWAYDNAVQKIYIQGWDMFKTQFMNMIIKDLKIKREEKEKEKAGTNGRSKEKMGVLPAHRLVRWALNKLMMVFRV